MYKYKDYRGAVQDLVRDKTLQTQQSAQPNEVDTALQLAVAEHSRQNPRNIVQEFTADGTRLFPLPDLWVQGLSDGTLKVEYPVDPTADMPRILPDDVVDLYNTPTGYQFRFVVSKYNNIVPISGDKFRTHFDTTHILSISQVTVPDMDFSAVTKLGSANLCLIIGNRLASFGNSAGRGDSVNFTDRQKDFMDYAREFRQLYQDEMSQREEVLKPGLVFGTFEEDEFNEGERTIIPTDESGRLFFRV